MLLTIDIGNTNVVLGVLKEDEIIKTYRLSSRVLKHPMNILLILSHF